MEASYKKISLIRIKNYQKNGVLKYILVLFMTSALYRLYCIDEMWNVEGKEGEIGHKVENKLEDDQFEQDLYFGDRFYHEQDGSATNSSNRWIPFTLYHKRAQRERAPEFLNSFFKKIIQTIFKV